MCYLHMCGLNPEHLSLQLRHGWPSSTSRTNTPCNNNNTTHNQKNGTATTPASNIQNSTSVSDLEASIDLRYRITYISRNEADNQLTSIRKKKLYNNNFLINAFYQHQSCIIFDSAQSIIYHSMHFIYLLQFSLSNGC